ncbi:SIR2 family protein [Halarcobacter anaerophilus]|uniref:SIR2 family protein n=1 Tax=Halarcobacter anaerophilus TaxID=877500 RepID=UPI0005C93DDC|nr:SIR2 family protein [Halarcobacter anaerophilus]
MEILSIDDIRADLIEMIKKKSLIPIIGAGFTQGEFTQKNKNVPDGNQFQEIMIHEITKNSDFNSEEVKKELKTKNFNQISTYFFNNDVVNEDRRKEILQDYFLDVKLQNNKKNILNDNLWPYIYTFNIDNAIEKHSKFREILPYKQINIHSRDTSCVYKVHGDVWHEVMYNEESSLIFSEPQYIQSLIKNQSMLTFLKSDYIDNNIIFIGCSLASEVDLLYAISGDNVNYNEGAKRILVMRNREISPIEKLDYKKYGINTLLLIDSYEQFYNFIYSLLIDLRNESRDISILDIYKINSIFQISENKNNNINALLQINHKLTYKNNLVKPNYIIDRDLSNALIKSVMDNPITVLKGKRFSGKSTIAINLFERNKQRDFYYINSHIKIDKNLIDEFFNISNSIIYIDSNVVDQEMAVYIKKNIDKLKSHTVSVIIVCNNMELDIANTFALLSYDNYYFDLNNRLKHNELIELNKKLSDLGIVEFRDRKTLLDNIYEKRTTYRTYIPKTVSEDYEITFEDSLLLVILSIFDKTYIPVCVALGITAEKWQSFVKKFSPVIELEETDINEREQHSRFKITVNSSMWLKDIIRNYNSKISHEDILKIIKKLIITFKDQGHYRIIQQRVMMFDSLNEIMGKGNGSLKLMLYLYENLSKQLSDIPDYWLQRAKAVYKLEKKNKQNLFDAIDYAKKAYFDAKRQRTSSNAEFMIALLYGKLCLLEDYKNFQNIEEAIQWFYKAIKNHEYNKTYILSMLDNRKSSRGVFSQFCHYLEKGKDKNIKILEYKDQIEEILEYSR